MMSLQVQIHLILYSYIYGFIFSLLLSYSYPYIEKQKKIPQILLSFLFVINAVFIYFAILRKINYGVLHFYSFLLVTLGFISEHVLMKFLDKKRGK